MANSYTHAGLPYPIYNAKYTLLIPYLDADGDPTDPTTPDTEISKDGGSFADCTEEVTTITGSNGTGYITLTGAEMQCVAAAICGKVASGPKATLAFLQPRILPVISNGTAQSGGNTAITLASGAPAYDLTGCFVRTTGGTGGGGTNGANNQARMITAYNVSTKEATVFPAWETNPANDTTYDILLSDLSVNNPVNTDVDTLLSRIVGTLASGTHNPQSGDAYPIVNNVTYGNSALNSDLDTLLTRISANAALNSDMQTLLARITAAVALNSDIQTLLTRIGTPAGASIAADIGTRLPTTSYTTPPTAADIRTEIDANSTKLTSIEGVTDKLDTAMEADLAVYRFTANALELAPSGSGGGSATLDNQTTIINHLTDIKGTGFAGAQNSLKAIRDRGDAAWITGGGMTGSSVITITLRDTSNNNIVEASVEIYDSAGTTLYEKKFSSSSGQAVFNGNDGSYIVKVHKAGYSFENTSLTVSGNTARTITGSTFAITPPSDPTKCRLYTTLWNPDGAHPSEVNATCRIRTVPDISGGHYSKKDPDPVYTAATGVLYFDVAMSATVEVNAVGFVKQQITVGTSATQQF